MDIKDRAISARDSLTRKRLEHKLDGVQEDNSELSLENKVLGERVHRDDHEIDRILSALENMSAKGKKHRVRRLAALALAAGGAYVMGAKAGRERFDEINDRWQRVRDNLRDKGMKSADRAMAETLDIVAEAIPEQTSTAG